jgi:hypothetical protein
MNKPQTTEPVPVVDDGDEKDDVGDESDGGDGEMSCPPPAQFQHYSSKKLDCITDAKKWH